MKAKLIIFFMLDVVAQNICNAQNVFPTIADNPRWRVAERVVYQPPFPMYHIDYTLEKDTLINGLTYSIITGSDTSNSIYKTYRVGFTRTVEKKVYFKNIINGIEYLIYDFGLNVGESCYCFILGYDTAEFTVIKVDTIKINGFERRRLQVEPVLFFPTYWIEGIGSIQNPFISYRSGVHDELRCLTTNSGTIYIDPKYKECDSNNSYTHSIVNTNTQWSGLNIKSGQTGTDSLYSYYIRFNGDSINNYRNYTKIWKSYDSLAKDWQLCGLIRELYKQTWFRPLGDDDEYLLYDFSPGNKLMIFSPPSSIRYVDVTSVDSVEINGEKRLQIQLSYKGVNIDTWIEKIGSMHGILNSCYDTPGWANNLLCVTEDSKLIYSNQNYPDCYYTMKLLSNKTQTFEKQKIAIYPNPVTNKLIISNQTGKPEKFEIQLFDANGILVYNKILLGLSNEIDVSTIPAGLYFVQIITDNRVINEKIIKQ